MTHLTPVPEQIRKLHETESASLAGNYIDFPANDFVWEDLRRYAVVLIGLGYSDAEPHLNNVRESFYSLHIHHSEFLKIIDLGNVLVDRGDNLAANKIEFVLKEIIKYNVFIIPFGKSPVYLNYCYNALKTIDDSATITYISNSASVGSADDNLSRQNHLAYLLGELDNKLFSLNILGYQLYQTNPQSIELLNNLYCQTMRLGSLRNDFKSVEPTVRDSDLLAINMSAVRQCDAPASLQPSPNGFYAEEACQLSRYGGISDRLVIGSIFGFDLEKDLNGSTSQLVAQLIWHFIDGYIARKNDNPLKNVNRFKKYIVDMGAPSRQLIFHYSEFSERWWMEVPRNDSATSLLIACSYDDYRSACNHEVPLRWVWFHQKLSQKNNID